VAQVLSLNPITAKKDYTNQSPQMNPLYSYSVSFKVMYAAFYNNEHYFIEMNYLYLHMVIWVNVI
jgi:hypothetical protein